MFSSEINLFGMSSARTARRTHVDMFNISFFHILGLLGVGGVEVDVLGNTELNYFHLIVSFELKPKIHRKNSFARLFYNAGLIPVTYAIMHLTYTNS